MKMLYSILLLVLLVSCKDSDDNSIIIINPTKFIENKITLADIADDISYIPLDNTYQIEEINKVKVVKESIYVRPRKMGLIAFDREGKTPRKIGDIGRGPGQYNNWWMSFVVDEKNRTVYILDSDENIKIYTKNGDYLRNISLKQYNAFSFSDIELSGSRLFAFEYIGVGQGKYYWIVLDTLGNLIKYKNNSIPAFTTNIAGGGGVYRNGSHLSYWNLYNDTIFSILPDLSYKPSFIMATGEFRLPKLRLTDLSKYIFPWVIMETNRYLVFETHKYEKTMIASTTLIDKKNKKTYMVNLDVEDNGYAFNLSGGIINDLDGGQKFRPIGYFEEDGNEYLIGEIHAFQLKAHVAGNEFKNSSPKFPEKKKELEKLANSLKETDNPVLVIVRLKK